MRQIAERAAQRSLTAPSAEIYLERPMIDPIARPRSLFGCKIDMARESHYLKTPNK